MTRLERWLIGACGCYLVALAAFVVGLGLRIP